MTMIHPYVWGFSGQSHVTEYPRAWYGLRQELVATHSKVVVLPWQLYSAHTLTDKTTANPAIAFFQPYALASNLMALPGVAETEFGCRPDIHAAITKKDRHLFTKVATSCGATHVIITERGQNDDYAWLIPPQDDSSAYSEKTMIIRLDRV